MSVYSPNQQLSQRHLVPSSALKTFKHQSVRRRYNINRMFHKDQYKPDKYLQSLLSEFWDFDKFLSQLQRHPDMYYKVQYQSINQHVRKFKSILLNPMIIELQPTCIQQSLLAPNTHSTKSLNNMPARNSNISRTQISNNSNEPISIKNIQSIIANKEQKSQCFKKEYKTAIINQKIRKLNCDPKQYIVLKELIKLASEEIKYKIYLPALAKVTMFGINQLDRNKSASQIKIRIQLKVKIPGFKSYPEYYKKMFTRRFKLKIKSQLLIAPEQKLIHLDNQQLCGLRPELFHPTASGTQQHHYRYQVYDNLDKYLRQIYNWDEYQINHIKREEFYKFDQRFGSVNHNNSNQTQKGQFQGLIFVIDIIHVPVLNQRKSFLSPFQIIDLNGIIDICPIQTCLKQWQNAIFLVRDQFRALSMQVDPKFQINFNLISLYPQRKNVTPTTNILYNHIYATDRMQIGQFTLAENYMFLETSNSRKGSYKLKKGFLSYYWELKKKKYFQNIMKTSFGNVARDYGSYHPVENQVIKLMKLLEQLTKTTAIYLQKCKSLKAYIPQPPYSLSQLQYKIETIPEKQYEIIFQALPSTYPSLLSYIEEIDYNLHKIDFQLQKSLQIQCSKQLIQGIQDMIVYIENRRMKLWQLHQFILSTIVNIKKKDNRLRQAKLQQYIYQIRKYQQIPKYQVERKKQMIDQQNIMQINNIHPQYNSSDISRIQLISFENRQLQGCALSQLQQQAQRRKEEIQANEQQIKELKEYLKNSKHQQVESISFKKDWYDNEFNTNKAHFHFPFYRTPGPALTSTFISLIMQSISNLVIFFQPGDSVFAQVGTFTAVVIGIGGLISSIQSQIILKDKQTLVQFAVYLMFLTPFLTILWRAFASNQNHNPLKHPIFWICMVIMLFSILCPIYIQLHYVYMKKRKFHSNLTILKGYQPVYLMLPGSHQLDLLLGAKDNKSLEKHTLTETMLKTSLNMINYFLEAYQRIKYQQIKISDRMMIIKQKSTQIREALISEESNNSTQSTSDRFHNQVKYLVQQYERTATNTSIRL